MKGSNRAAANGTPSPSSLQPMGRQVWSTKTRTPLGWRRAWLGNGDHYLPDGWYPYIVKWEYREDGVFYRERKVGASSSSADGRSRLEHHPETRAFAGFGGRHEDLAFVNLFHDPLGQGQAQTPATLLGRKAGSNTFLATALLMPLPLSSTSMVKASSRQCARLGTLPSMASGVRIGFSSTQLNKGRLSIKCPASGPSSWTISTCLLTRGACTAVSRTTSRVVLFEGGLEPILENAPPPLATGRCLCPFPSTPLPTPFAASNRTTPSANSMACPLVRRFLGHAHPNPVLFCPPRSREHEVSNEQKRRDQQTAPRGNNAVGSRPRSPRRKQRANPPRQVHEWAGCPQPWPPPCNFSGCRVVTRQCLET